MFYRVYESGQTKGETNAENTANQNNQTR
ncbi:hypothetical protein P5664_22175 [Bacillus subtilis]